MDRPKDRGEARQTDGVGVNWWADKWGGHRPSPVGERGEAGGQVDRQLPVPVTLGASHRRQAGPDPEGSPQGGGHGGLATPPGPSLPAPQVPAPAARPRGACVQGGLGPTEEPGSWWAPSLCPSALRMPRGVPSPRPSIPVSLRLEDSSGTGGIGGGSSTRLVLNTQLLLSPQKIQTSLEKTGKNYGRLEHVWKVNREGEVSESPPLPSAVTTQTCREVTLTYLPLSESS